MPDRIQRLRTAGWRMPDGAVYVGRPTIWGNPFRIGGPLEFPYADAGMGEYVRDAAHAVELFRAYTRITPAYRLIVRPALVGRDLVCWCPPTAACHADVLLEIANGAPCPECGPGYHYGDDGCRHTPEAARG